MEQILKFYSENETLINLIKDIVYFFGAFTVIKYLWNWSFVRKTEKIESNLNFRERIEAALDDYVIKENKNGIKQRNKYYFRIKNVAQIHLFTGK